MTGEELIIVFRQDKGFLTPDSPLTFEQIDLPEISKSFKATAFWSFRVINFDRSKKKIFAEIQSYQVGPAQFSLRQQQLSEQLREVEKITFRSIDTGGLLQTLASTTPLKVTVNASPTHYNETVHHAPIQTITDPIKYTIKENFFVALKDVRFKTGGVCFDKKFAHYPKSIEIDIINYDIREEFDAVKNYFANILGTKKIEASVIIEVVGGKVDSVKASSPEIAKINQQLIENVKFEFVKQLIKTKISAEIDKSLFTMDEYFDTFADAEFKSNTFHNSDTDLFDDLLTISNTKHYKHLRFLSSRHSHGITKLRFVHKPFSFIFLLKGDKHFHIIWETLDTEEATYIWHIEQDMPLLKATFEKINAIINSVKIHGKTSYINFTEDRFKRIYHDYSELVEGFVKWKGELESILT